MILRMIVDAMALGCWVAVFTAGLGGLFGPTMLLFAIFLTSVALKNDLSR